MVAGSDIVSYALAQRGDPYVWGAEGPNAYDCSGLVWDAARHYGIRVPRTTADMMGPGSNLVPIGRGDLQAGDLIFSNWIGKPHSHVGIYTGNDSIVEAPQPGQNVMVTPLGPNYWAHTDAFRRMPGIDGPGASVDPGAAGGLQAGLTAGGQPGLATLAGWITEPKTATDALTNVGNAMFSVASSAANVGRLAGAVTRMFLPSNLLRGAALAFGTVFILIGIWFIGREIRE